MAAIVCRVKRLRHIQCFLRFTHRSNSSFKHKLHEALVQCSLSQNDVKFVPYCVSSTVFGSSFSRGAVDINAFLMNEEGQETNTFFEQSEESLVTYQVGFHSIFREAIKKLHQYIKGEEVEEFLPPLAALMRFMTDKDFHESSLQSMIVNKELQGEVDISTILSVHLFSQLAFNDEPSYMISNDYNFKHKFCPCDNSCRKPVMYGDTSIGTYALWHGRPDIVIFPNGAGSSSIVVQSGKDKVDTLKKFKDDDVHMVEVKCDSSALRSENNVKQISLIAMTFSFYQRVVQHRIQLQGGQKKAKNSRTVSLVPTVALSSESFDIYMYDTEHDIFLRNLGKPVPLWNFDKNNNPTLNLSSVLYLWMIINHLSFKPAVTKDVIRALKGKCGLREKLSDKQIEYIEKNIKLPMFRSHNLREGMVEKARKIELGTEENQDDSEDL